LQDLTEREVTQENNAR